MDSKNIDEDKALDLIDLFHDVRNKAHADNCTDVEMEAIASAYLGHIYYLGLKNPTSAEGENKAKKYYNDCQRLLMTLQPKTFNGEKWHQDLMTYLNEINQKQIQDEEKKKADEAPGLRNSCKKEIDELWHSIGPPAKADGKF